MERVIEFMHLATWLLLAAALGFAFYRLVKGPSLPDRVVALELLASLTVGVIAAYVLRSGKVVLLDVAMVLALTAFLAAVGFARYLEQGASQHD